MVSNKKLFFSFVVLIFNLLIITFTTASYSQAAPPAESGLTLALSPFASGFNAPVSVKNAGGGDGRLFVVEKGGLIRIIQRDGTILPTPFLDISDQVNNSGEGGFLGLAFHPDYVNNGYFYVNYTTVVDGPRRTHVSRFQVSADPNIADDSSESILFTVEQPFSNHNAGDLNFGADGYLYVPLGDGGSGGDPGDRAQNLSLLLGKIVRIDVDAQTGAAPDCQGEVATGTYTIPPSNPLQDGSGGTCDEIWAIGFRNPWRFSFDRLTGDMYLGDVGQNSVEEVDYQPANSTGGENYGWRCYEGSLPYNLQNCGPIESYVFPIFEYDNSPCYAVAGGYVYRGSQFPALNGRYFVTDACANTFWDIVPGTWQATTHTNLQGTGYLVGFGESANCELYVVDHSSGTIYHLQAAAPTSTAPAPPPTRTTTGLSPCNDRPDAADDGFTVDEDDALLTTAPGVLANDSDLNGDALTAVLVDGPDNGTLSLDADGAFTYTPDPDFDGTDTFTYQAHDGSHPSLAATVTIDVNGINDAPTAVEDTYFIGQNTTLSIAAPGVLNNDEDVEADPLTAVLDQTTISGTLSLDADGAFSYTPTVGFTGSDNFYYHAHDGLVDSNTISVTIQVLEPAAYLPLVIKPNDS